MSRPRINVVTLGCPKNQVDSEVLLGYLKVGDGTIVESGEESDITVVNTCGFIEAAKRESIDTIMEAVEEKRVGRTKRVIVMGCLTERYGKELTIEIPEIDQMYGSDQIEKIIRDLGFDYKKELLGERVLTTPSHYAYLKISEGCDRPCSFCAIPIMRGSHVSRPFNNIVSESKRLAERGVKELIIIGQDTTYYGLDLYGERQLAKVLRTLCKIDELEWIRLMYTYPAGFPKDLFSVMRENPKICRYIDIPFQHISDPVLHSMRRGITSGAIRDLISTMKSEIPDIAIRTTLIVGYPNETEKDFQELLDFVRETRFHRLGVFTYSHEEGTTAANLGDLIPQKVKEERQAAIMALQQEISEERNQEMIGKTVRVLIDRKDDEFFVGRTEWDAPEIDQEVFVASKRELSPGSFVDILINDGTEYDLYGEEASVTIK